MRVALAVALPIAMLATGCADKITKEEKRYEIVKRNGDADAICGEGRKVVEAYLEAGNGEAYHERDVATAIECQSARREAQETKPDQMVTQLP